MENKTKKTPSHFFGGGEEKKNLGPERPERDFGSPETPPRRSEGEPTPEQRPEREPEHVQESEPSVTPVRTQTQQPATPQAQPRVRIMESILAEGMEDLYVNLPPEKQQQFKAKGEETSREILTLFEKGKATLKKVYALVLGWLKILPGLNQFFLEKEAKLKTDKIFKTFHK